MKMVISASRRTDIPAFYLKWFMDGIRRGFLEVRNPFYPQQVKRVDLRPEAVAWIVFWSRNYAHFLKNRSFFDAYRLFFHFTILSPSPLEKYSMPFKTQLRQLEQLTSLYGPQRVMWRYDPLVFWQNRNGEVYTNFKEDEFKILAQTVSQLGIKRCTISMASPYAKFQKRFSTKFSQHVLMAQNALPAQKTVRTLVEIAGKYAIQIEACCNDFLLEIEGVKKARCVDGNLLNQLAPADQKVSVAKAPSREQCACTRSIDIGDYRQQPCQFGCIYCYANPVWK